MKKALSLLLSISLSALLLASCSLQPPQQVSVGQNAVPVQTPASSAAPAPSPAEETPRPANTPSGYAIPKAPEGEFKSPDDALAAFADALKNNDFMAASEAFAVYEIPGHFDYQAWSDRLKVVYTSQSLLPGQNTPLNVAIMWNTAATCYRSALFGLSGLDWQTAQVQKSGDDTAHFIDALSPDKLKGLTMKAADMESTLSADMKTAHEKNMAEEAKVYGADACKVYVVELDLGGNRACCNTMMLVEYGGCWKIAGGLFSLAGAD